MSSSEPPLFERLAKVEPAKLARLLAELASQDPTVLEQVQFLLAAGNAAASAKTLRSTLRAWTRSQRFIPYQEAFGFGDRLEGWLDRVEEELLNQEPALALDLLEAFLQSDHRILGRADDSAGCLGTAYRRACPLFARAAAGVASPADLAGRVTRLVEKDDYGVRHGLLEHVPQFLGREAIGRLVARWRKQAAPGAGSRRDRAPLLRIQAVAASTGDAPLYAEAALEGRSADEQPLIGLQVAQQFVLAGRPAEALAYVPAEANVPSHWFDEYAETLGRVYEALGRAEELRELRQRHFLQRPDPERLERYLGGLAAEARPAAKERMRQAVLSGGYDPTQKAAFFAELGDGATAAQVILADPTAFGRAAYPALRPLARRLEASQPLAASIVYRALVDSILERAQPKAYPHAARYLRRLGQLAAKIRAWSPVAPHDSYLQALRARHGRKRAFWAQVAEDHP
jgi:hypothetical protein